MILVRLAGYIWKNAEYIHNNLQQNSKWVKDLNIRTDVLNLIEEKVENSLEIIGTGKEFLNRTMITKNTKNN